MSLNPRRAIAELQELRELTEGSNGAQRIAWTDTWTDSRTWLRGKAKDLTHHRDPAGNDWYTLAGESEKALLIGSHLDSVPNGGWLDGALGVVAALEVVRRFADQYNGRPPLTLRLVDFADEEGARFARSLLGSSAFAGTHSIETDRHKRDSNGITLQAALKDCGVDIDRFPEAEAGRQNAAAYLELHIEQGPRLEQAGLPLAVVLGTKGVERHGVAFQGQEAHAGTTPMEVRRDALIAAAKLAVEAQAIARRHNAVCTMGSVRTFPGIATAVPGRCETTLDLRDLDSAVLAQMLAEARAFSHHVAAEQGCTVEWSRIWNIQPVSFHPVLIGLCGQAIAQTTGEFLSLPSGALHDAAEVARAGIPSVMMFVQSLGGISHNKIEDTRIAHLEIAVQALDRLATLTAEWILSGK